MIKFYSAGESNHIFFGYFYVTGKSVSSHGHKHMQFFVSDKWIDYVVIIKEKICNTIAHTVKRFSKEIGDPMDLVFDALEDQRSSELNKAAAEMDLTLAYWK